MKKKNQLITFQKFMHENVIFFNVIFITESSNTTDC